MPSMMPAPKKSSDEVGSTPSSISPTLGVSAEASTPSLDMPASAIPGTDSSPVGLNEKTEEVAQEPVVNKHFLQDEESELKKPKYTTAETKIHNSLKIPESKEGFEAIATRPGFYNQFRLKTDDQFTIDSFEAVGDWMRMVDPDHEKKRVQFLREKKEMQRRKMSRY